MLIDSNQTAYSGRGAGLIVHADFTDRVLATPVLKNVHFESNHAKLGGTVHIDMVDVLNYADCLIQL